MNQGHYTKVGKAQVIVAGSKILIASESQPGIWYEPKADWCPCRGFKESAYPQHCIHTITIAAALTEGSAEDRALKNELREILNKADRGEVPMVDQPSAVIQRMIRSKLVVIMGCATIDGFPVPTDVVNSLIDAGKIRAYSSNPIKTTYVRTDIKLVKSVK